MTTDPRSHLMDQLPQYESDKVVGALKMRAVLIKAGLGPGEDKGEYVLTFDDPGYEAAAYVVSADYVRKHNPQAGGYYVVYEDGYQSWSPAEAFEGGYIRIWQSRWSNARKGWE